VDESRFQSDAEPFPGHWRSPPAAWPEDLGADRDAAQVLQDGLRALPEPWRAVVAARDVDGRPAEEVAARLGLTVDQQQRILTHARAALRDELAALVARRRSP
jgi:RNA polymerase sigma-70 factor (ECF subfamily)